MALVKIVNRGSVCFYDTQNKIMGKIPTNSNWNRKNTDNHLHFGTPGNNPIAENYIQQITGHSVYEFANNLSFPMIFNGRLVNVVTSISAQNHIQLLIEVPGVRSMLKNIILEYLEDTQIPNMNDSAVFFDFKNNKIFVDRVDSTGATPTLCNLIENAAKNEIDNAMSEASSINDINKKNAYIETVMRTRSSAFQRIYRQGLINEFGCKCAICNINKKELLVASHIVAYSDCANNEERIDTDNGLLLCANHDALFDKGFISFDSTGKIILPKTANIPSSDLQLFNIDSNTRLQSSHLNSKRIGYLSRHKKIY